MADRTVNVNIRYNVDSAQVTKAEQLLRQAQNASNSFQSSSQKAGQNTASAFSNANKSILSMQLSLAQLKSRIEVASDPKAVQRLSQEYRNLKSQLDAATKSAFQLPKALNDTAKSGQSLTSQFGNLYNAAKLFLTAGIVKETISMTLEMAKLAGNVEGVERAFNRAFVNPVVLLKNLKEATHGTVSEFELMQRTLQATNLGVAVEELPILFEFAAARAQQTGESVDYLVDSIVRGIGRKSILVLDNLGLSATRLKEQFNGASLASQSVAEVTRGVAEIARVELEKMGGYAETSATKVDQLSVAVEELRVSLSKKIDSSGLINILTESAKGFKAIIDTYDPDPSKQIDNLKKWAVNQGALNLAIEDFNRIKKQEFKTDQERNDFIQQQINTRVQLIGKYNDEIKSIKELDASNRSLETYKKIVDKEGYTRGEEIYNQNIRNSSQQLKSLQNNKVVISETIKLLSAYLNELKKIGSETTTETPGLIEDLEEKIKSLGESIRSAKTEQEIFKLNVQLAILQDRLRELKDLGKEGNKLAPELPPLKLKFELPTSDDIEGSTANLFAEIARKQGEEFNKALGETIDISTEFERALFEAREELATTGIDIFADQLVSIEMAEVASLENRLNNLRNYYDEQMLLAGDNERAKSQLRLREERDVAALQRRIAARERQARIFSILVDTAAGIAKNIATYPYPYWIAPVAITAAQGASQLAIASRAQARFAKGGLNIQGPGTGTSDSIPAQISKGESVMTAQEWKTSKGVLKAVRAKTLDDKVLADLKLTREGVRYMGMDDKNIVREIRDLRNSIPDVEERAGIVYKTRIKRDNYKQWIRQSSMGK